MMTCRYNIATVALLVFFALGGDASAKTRRLSSSRKADEGRDGAAELGADCYSDSACASEICSSRLFFWKGSCVECNTDEDCPGQGESTPGEHPRAFCFKEEENDANARCSEWKQGEPINEKGYPIWYHGAPGAQWIPRTTIDEGPVMDQVWHWDLNNQPDDTEFILSETHVSIPLNSHTLAAYSRTYHNYQEHETGIVTVAFLNNPMSVLTPNPVAGMVEKYHTLTYDGIMSTAKADRVRKEVETRSEAAQRQAKRGRTWRSMKMGAALTGLGAVISQQLEAGKDERHLDQIRDHIQQLLRDETSMDGIESTGWLDHSEKARQALADATTLPSLKSENHCKHFESGAGIEVTDTHIVIPLNSAFMANSGEMQFSPAYYFGLNSGVMLARHDESSGTLEIFYQASQMFRGYSDPKIAPEEWPFPSGLWVAPVHPSVPVMSTDGRTDQFYESEGPSGVASLQFLINQYLDVPVDYSMYDGGMEKTCPTELRDRLKPVWLRAKLEEMGQGAGTNLMSRLSGMTNVLLAAVVGAPCGATFMRSDYGPGTMGLEMNEYSSWAHMILEVDPEKTETLVTSQFWDDWDAFFKSGIK